MEAPRGAPAALAGEKAFPDESSAENKKWTKVRTEGEELAMDQMMVEERVEEMNVGGVVMEEQELQALADLKGWDIEIRSLICIERRGAASAGGSSAGLASWSVDRRATRDEARFRNFDDDGDASGGASGQACGTNAICQRRQSPERSRQGMALGRQGH